MGILSRIALIIKGYVTTAGDKIERAAAEEELRLARARENAAEELRRIDRLSDRTAPAVSPAPAPPLSSQLTADYKLLGLRPDPDLEAVEARWRELAGRADPKRFPNGSDEEKKASEILASVNQAYARIREHLNPTEGRFGRLEF